jgi:hypothetical protein
MDHADEWPAGGALADAKRRRGRANAFFLFTHEVNVAYQHCETEPGRADPTRLWLKGGGPKQ